MGDMSREPSMEEILSSIRRVIARDEASRDAALAARLGDGARDSGAHRAEPDHLAPETAESSADDDVLELTEIDDAAAPVVAEPDPVVGGADGVDAVSEATEIEAEIVSPTALEASRAALGALSRAVSPEAAPAPVSATPGTTVEAIAEAAMRPLLKAWLDEHLPPMVERMVAREIARITGGRV